MKRTFTFLMTALFLCVGMVKAAVTDLPQMSEDGDIKWYTIKNVRTQKFATYAGDEATMTQEATASAASFFYFTASTTDGAVKIHNYAAGEKLCAAYNSWTATGIDWYLAAQATGVSICTSTGEWNAWNDASGGGQKIEYWSASDAGSAWIVELVTDFTSVINITALKEAAVTELNNLASVTTLYPAATDDAVAKVNAVEAAGTGLAELNAAVEAINAVVAEYKAAAYEALDGKYFTIQTLSSERPNGFMKMEGARVVGISEVNSPAAVWQFEYADGAVKVYNPYAGKYLCEPAGVSENIAVDMDETKAGAYDLVVNANAENAGAKVKLTSNGKSVHMAGHSVLVRWDNGGASEWQVTEITDFSNIISLHKAATLANLNEYAKLPSVFDEYAVADAKAAVEEVEDEGLGLVTCKVIDNLAGQALPYGNFAFQATSTDNHRDNVWVSANMETSKAIGATEQDANAHWMLEPASAGAFYLYNMANDCYMGNPDGNCALTSAPMVAYTIEAVNAENNIVELKCGGQTLHASNHNDDKLMNYDGDEDASRWTISVVIPTLEVTNVTVGETVVDDLSAIVAKTEDMIYVNFGGMFYYQGDPVIVDAKGDNAPLAFEYWTEMTSYAFSCKEVGTYTITLPKSSFLNYSSYYAPAADIVLTVQITDDLTDGIENIETETETVIYDLSGRRVEKMEKGIYIVNGKKVIK